MSHAPIQTVKLFVSSDCDLCDQAETFLRDWAATQPDVHTDVIPILSQPEEVVRLRIFYTPAFVINGNVVETRALSLEEITILLEEIIQ